MKKLRRMLLVLSLMIVVLASASVNMAFAVSGDFASQYRNNKEYVWELANKEGGLVYGDEWMVLALARSEDSTYKEALEQYVENIGIYLNENGGRIAEAQSTDYSRFAIAMASLGIDMHDVFGYDITNKWLDYNLATNQGVNALVYMLIALDTSNSYDNYQNLKERLVGDILAKELPQGGWNFGTEFEGSNPDPDMTAMVIQSLANYTQRADVSESVNRGIEVLRSMQGESGALASYGTENSNSTAQTIVALTTLGIDPMSDSRFLGKDKNIVEVLGDYATAQGGYSWMANSDVDAYSSVQVLYAQVAYDRFLYNKLSLYNMRDGASYSYVMDSVSKTVPENKSGALVIDDKSNNKLATYKGLRGDNLGIRGLTNKDGDVKLAENEESDEDKQALNKKREKAKNKIKQESKKEIDASLYIWVAVLIIALAGLVVAILKKMRK